MNVEIKNNEFLIKIEENKIFLINPHGENKELYEWLKVLLGTILNNPQNTNYDIPAGGTSIR
jgi:hypothetical protein